VWQVHTGTNTVRYAGILQSNMQTPNAWARHLRMPLHQASYLPGPQHPTSLSCYAL
jgi:hypothetical protein